MTEKRMKLLLGISMPIALQNLINFAVNLMDTVMLGQLGEMPLAASSLANQAFFVVTLVVYGIGEGANVLAAQSWGRKEIRPIYRILTYTYRLAAGFAFLVSVFAIGMPQFLMRVFTKDTAVIELGVEYLKIAGWSYLFFTATTVTLCVLRAVHVVKIATVLSLVCLCVNVSLNYILIFGRLGAPAMGIRGAAIATLVARIIEFTLLMVFLIRKERVLKLWEYYKARCSRIFRKRKENSVYDGGASLWKLYYTTSIPVVLNELLWALGEAAVSVILGRMGTEVVSANAIYANISELSGVVVSGMNSAACVIIGNITGEGNKEELRANIRLFQEVSVVVGVLGMVIMLVCRGFMIDLYKVTDVTKRYAEQIMLIGSAVELGRSIQCMNSMGILRGAGDVGFAMLNDILFLWCLTIPLGFFTALFLHWPVAAVYIALKLDQFLKIITSGCRVKYIERNS